MAGQIHDLIRALDGNPTRWNQGEFREAEAWFRGIARQLGAKPNDLCAEPCDTFSAVGFALQGSTRYLLRLHGAPFAIWSTTREAGKIDPCDAPLQAVDVDYSPATLLDHSIMRTRLTFDEWIKMGCDRASLLTWFHANSRPSVAEVCFNNYD